MVARRISVAPRLLRQRLILRVGNDHDGRRCAAKPLQRPPRSDSKAIVVVIVVIILAHARSRRGRRRRRCNMRRRLRARPLRARVGKDAAHNRQRLGVL